MSPSGCGHFTVTRQAALTRQPASTRLKTIRPARATLPAATWQLQLDRQYNTAVGFGALNPLTTGKGNTALGKLAGSKLTMERNNIDIGHTGKEAIKPMKETSEAILSLEPVTFLYQKAVDPAGIPQFGLVAEEVAKVDPDLVARDEEGKPYTVRYEAVNAMLLNEFLKSAHQAGSIGSKG